MLWSFHVLFTQVSNVVAAVDSGEVGGTGTRVEAIREDGGVATRGVTTGGEDEVTGGAVGEVGEGEWARRIRVVFNACACC